MPVRRAALRSSALLVALALTTACVPSIDGGADEGSSSSSSTSDSSAPSKGGQPLTEKQAEAALPDGSEIPGEITVDPEEPQDEDPDASSDPDVCRDIQLDGEEGEILDEETTVRAQRNYAGHEGGVVSVQVTSHASPVPGALFDDAGAAQSECAEFAKTDHGVTTTWKIVPANLEPMGDRTYVVGLRMLDGDSTFAGGLVRLAGVSIGHNLVYIIYSAGPESQLSPEVVEHLAVATVDNLEEL